MSNIIELMRKRTTNNTKARPWKGHSLQQLNTFLSKYPSISVDSKSKLFTHTQLHPNRSFNIPDDQLDTFYDLYKQCIDDGHVLSLTEKHREKYSPILIDIDFRYEFKPESSTKPPTPKRHHTRDHIKRFLEIYMDELQQIVQISNKSDRVACVLERDAPYISKPKATSKPIIKDGVHIIFPFIITNYTAQFWVRERTIERCVCEGIWKDLPIKFPSIPDDNPTKILKEVFDRAVIQQNNWYMFGSTKPNMAPYDLKYTVNFEDSSASASGTIEPVGSWKNIDLVRQFSIRLLPEENICATRYNTPSSEAYIKYQGKYENYVHKKLTKAQISAGQVIDPTDLEEYENKKLEEHEAFVAELTKSNYDYNGECEIYPCLVERNLNMISRLVDALGRHRCESRDSWMRVGWCLYAIAHTKTKRGNWEYSDEHRTFFFDLWKRFSQRTSIAGQYTGDQELKATWDSMQRGAYTIGSLFLWVQEDNPRALADIRRGSIHHVLSESEEGLPHAIARVLYQLNGNEFVCTDFKNQVWWRFESHRWKRSNGGVHLRRKLSNQLIHAYNSMCDYYSKKSKSNDSLAKSTKKSSFYDRKAKDLANQYAERKEQSDEKTKKIKKIISKLQQTAFKSNVMREAAEIFYKEDFEGKLNTNDFLLGFTNGVYDLKNMVFRAGRPDDYITLSTGYDYVPLVFSREADAKYFAECTDFLQKIFPLPDLLRWMRKVLGQMLPGYVFRERFWYWIGKGGNGKSKLYDLIKMTLGDYATELSVEYLVGKRKEADAPAPQLKSCFGTRFVGMCEPENGCTMNAGLMKAWSGSDTIAVRTLFQEPVRFKFQCMFALMCNMYPKLTVIDNAIRRRVRCIRFFSTFVEKEEDVDPSNFCFPQDQDLARKMQHWRNAFFHILLEGLKAFNEEGFDDEPQCVIDEGEAYFLANDIFTEFINDTIVERKSGSVNIRDLWSLFNLWHRENHAGESKPTKADLEGYMNNRFSKVHKTRTWKGLAIDWAPRTDHDMAEQLQQKGVMGVMINSDSDDDLE